MLFAFLLGFFLFHLKSDGFLFSCPCRNGSRLVGSLQSAPKQIGPVNNNSNPEKKRVKQGVPNTATAKPSSTGYRINKCISSLSRRSADQAIMEGRVTINGKMAKNGDMVNARDIVKLDGQVQHFKTLMKAKQVILEESELEDRNLIYLKYWKPVGVTCTSDPNDSTNLISAGRFDLFPQRLFSVGRLDKDSTGIILVTSDGRVNNALLSPSVSKEKVYEVRLNKAPTDADLARLRDGVVITTTSQKDSGSKTITAKTLPCKVTRNVRDPNTYVLRLCPLYYYFIRIKLSLVFFV
jgi:23S rRNA pseudouridine2604 synthase